MASVRSLVLLASIAATAASASTPAINGWYSCSRYTLKATHLRQDATPDPAYVAECATFKAPLSHDGVCIASPHYASTIDIFVKRIKAVAPGKPNVFFLQGGPGMPSTDMEGPMSGVYELLAGNVNVYTIDYRGTGRSTKLDCSTAQAETSGSTGGKRIDATEVADCAADIEYQFGSDMSAFSMTSAASDLKLFISSFLPNEKTYVYGVSYGSAVVERLMHLNPPGVAGYILDSVCTTSGSDKGPYYFSVADQNFDEVGDYFLSFCAKNVDDCGQYFKGTSVNTVLKKLLSDIDSPSFKCADVATKGLALVSNAYGGLYLPDRDPLSLTLRYLMGNLLTDESLRVFIPVLTHRLTRCSDDDAKALRQFFATFAQFATESPSEGDTYGSDLVFKMIKYSEFWESPTPSNETMFARFLNTTISGDAYGEEDAYCAFTKEKSATCSKFTQYQGYTASPLTYKKDQYWNAVARPPSDVSVLIMNSKMDPVTPYKYAERLLASLDTKNKRLISFEQATHGTVFSTPLPNADSSSAPTCGMMIVASYVAVGGDLNQVDRSCIDKLPAVTFKVPQGLVGMFLKAPSAMGGTA